MIQINLTGKNAVVAGGGGAIGFAIAELLAEAGAKITVFDIKLEALAGHRAITGRRVDLTSVDAINKAVEETSADGLDILVHAAGINPMKPLAELTEKEWDLLQSINLRSCVFLAKAMLPHMQEKGGGSIVFVSSCSAKLGYPGLINYCASKGGLDALVRSMACELACDNVRVNAIAPGTVKTPMTKHLWGDKVKGAAHEATIPLKRLADVKDQAMATLFLASDMSSYITGTVIPVDGGLTIMQQDFIDLKLRGW